MFNPKTTEICFLSGLEIPKGKYSKEHYVPKSRAPRFITANPDNIFPAHKIINHIKQNLLPCEWEDKKWTLTYHALHSWNLRHDDARFVARTLQNWESYHINPCKFCLLQCRDSFQR